MSQDKQTRASRREFLNTSGRVAAASALGFVGVPAVHAAENNTIKVALVGCGGRGTGAAINALSTKSGPTELVAMADVFDDRLQSSLGKLSQQLGKQVKVPKDRQFIGFDAYKKAIDCLDGNGVVILATPPGFRPLHVEYAVAQGCHVFMEKAFAVDGPGVRRVLKAGTEATKKNLKIAGGLMSRHYAPLAEAVRLIHDGIIGDALGYSDLYSRFMLPTDNTVDLGQEWTIASWFTTPLPDARNEYLRLTTGLSGGAQVIVNKSVELGTSPGDFEGCGYNMAGLADGWHHVAAVGSGTTNVGFSVLVLLTTAMPPI